MANPHGDDGGKNHENKHKINNAVRDFDAEDIQHTGQPPQHHAEPYRCDGGIEHAAHKFNSISDKFLRVLLDTLVDIVGRMAVGLQAVVVFVGQPARYQHFVEPLRPFNRQGLVEKVVHRAVERAQQHHGGIQSGKHPQGVHIRFLHGGVQPVGHKGAQHVQAHFGEQQHHHQRNEQHNPQAAFAVEAGGEHLAELPPEAGEADGQHDDYQRGGHTAKGFQKPQRRGIKFNLPFLHDVFSDKKAACTGWEACQAGGFDK